MLILRQNAIRRTFKASNLWTLKYDEITALLLQNNGVALLRGDMNRSHSLSSKASEMFYDASDQMAQEEATTSNSNQDDDDASSVVWLYSLFARLYQSDKQYQIVT